MEVEKIFCRECNSIIPDGEDNLPTYMCPTCDKVEPKDTYIKAVEE